MCNIAEMARTYRRQGLKFCPRPNKKAADVSPSTTTQAVSPASTNHTQSSNQKKGIA